MTWTPVCNFRWPIVDVFSSGLFARKELYLDEKGNDGLECLFGHTGCVEFLECSVEEEISLDFDIGIGLFHCSQRLVLHLFQIDLKTLLPQNKVITHTEA